jgi:dsRNA-specific ribonuclease
VTDAQTLRDRLVNRAWLSRVGLGLDLQDRIRIGTNTRLTQGMFEDVVEAIAGAILLELGYPVLYKWTVLVLGPMVEEYKRALEGWYR